MMDPPFDVRDELNEQGTSNDWRVSGQPNEHFLNLSVGWRPSIIRLWPKKFGGWLRDCQAVTFF
jgi:hypothetical protein